MTHRIITLTILALTSGCSPEYLECDVDYLLPGMWGGYVSLHNEAFVEIHVEADVHLQLFADPENEGSVVGWLYITSGEVYLEGVTFTPCVARPVSGELEATDEGIRIPCMMIEGAEEAGCITVEANANSATISATRFFYTLSGELGEYEALAERDQEIFSCLNF